MKLPSIITKATAAVRRLFDATSDRRPLPSVLDEPWVAPIVFSKEQLAAELNDSPSRPATRFEEEIVDSYTKLTDDYERLRRMKAEQARQLSQQLVENKALSEKVTWLQTLCESLEKQLAATEENEQQLQQTLDTVLEIAGVEDSSQLIAAVKEWIHKDARGEQLTLDGVPPAEGDPAAPDVEVYNGTSEFGFDIVRLSFREHNKWFLSQGKDGLEIAAEIADKEWLKKVADRKVFFAAGDFVVVLLHTISRRRGDEPVRSEYIVEKVIKHLPPQEQLELATSPDTLRQGGAL